MDMEDCLACFLVTVHYQAITILIHTILCRDGFCCGEQSPHHRLVLICHIVDRGDMLPWYDQDMQWSLWIHIIESDDIIILIDDIALYLTISDLAE